MNRPLTPRATPPVKNAYTLSSPVLSPANSDGRHFKELAMLEPIEQERKMEMQSHQICVIDLFGVSYDGTMPSIMLAYDETWLGLFAVGPPNPPAVEAADRPDGRLCLFL
jgi:hypothetical protein